MDLAREKKIMLEDDKELTADDVMKRKNDEPTTKRAEVTAGRAKAVIEKEDEDAKDAPPELEKRVNAMIDVLKEVNLGIDEELSPTYLSDLLAIDEEIIYIELLKEFKDVFDWSYKEMPDLDPKVVVHHLAVKNNACPVKHAQMFFRPDLVPLIESEVNKLIESGFIREFNLHGRLDGAAHHLGAGASVVFVSFQGEVMPYSFTLTQLCSNNVAEYQALILGLEMVVEMKRLQLQIFGDSQLVINQLLGSYEVMKPELCPYHDYAKNING
uniref:RNase H type-1 domain-containing protein n=1 Tax=Nicotiana tabacum TaxID=4097 RepID=A0A1S4BC46_TOBAC